MRKYLLTSVQLGVCFAIVIFLFAMQHAVNRGNNRHNIIYSGPYEAKIEGIDEEAKLIVTTEDGTEFSSDNKAFILFYYQHKDEELIYDLNELDEVSNISYEAKDEEGSKNSAQDDDS